MKNYEFELLLRSDAEPASGMGGELLNSMLPKDEKGCFIIPGSHLKGVMRENLFNLLSPLRKDAAKICGILFGNPGELNEGGNPGVLHITNAAALPDAKTLTITRTAVGPDGVASDTSLRTTEALAKGTCLKGRMSCDTTDVTIQKLCRLALLTVTAVGGGRTRGSGECKITFPAFPAETPGKLLKEIAAAEIRGSQKCFIHNPNAVTGGDFKAVRLVFESSSPICIPERPAGKNNVIGSADAIPGTAVAGVLLNLFSERDQDLSSGCCRSEVFRCFPLLPTPEGEDPAAVLRVSNTHKISKLCAEGKNHLFGDLMIPDKYLSDPRYRWQEQSRTISMKGVSGMLVVGNGGDVKLLRSGDIPRYYSAHGVVNGEGEKKDDLFTMESIRVKKFTALAILPVKAAQMLLEILKEGRQVFFGKSKSTMGGGILKAQATPLFEKFDQYHQVEKLRNRLFIVQSPIVYDSPAESSSRDIINKVLNEAGWGEVAEESVMTSVLFGWNSMKLDRQLCNSGRVQAKRVITPGSVFLLKEPLSSPVEKIAKGLGSDRYAGYGAVMPHPMFATALCSLEKDAENTVQFGKCSGSPVFCGYRLHRICGKKLSASQIANLMSRAETSVEEAENFLEEQRLYRPEDIWDAWKSVKEILDKYFKSYSRPDVIRMLRVWHDLNVGDK